MFDSFTEGHSYYDYPSLEVAIFSLALALVLSSMIAFTYRFTTETADFSKPFFQSMVLSALVTSMIMMAVGNNLAVGFGIIGAVAIIRFRTNIQNPRNVIFIFSALSVGIATGVYGYAVAFSGSLIFCFTAWLLYWSPFGRQVYDDLELNVQLTQMNQLDQVHQVLGDLGITFEMTDYRQTIDQNFKIRMSLQKPKSITVAHVFLQLNQLPELKEVRITNQRTLDQL